PTTNDDVLITLSGTYTVTLNVSASIKSLTHGGSTGTQTLLMSANSLASTAVSTVQSNGVFNFNGGSLNGPLTVATNALVNWSGGSLNSALSVAGGGLLTISNGVTLADVNHNSTTLTNNGTVVWVAGHITGSDGARIYNAGLWQIVTT